MAGRKYEQIVDGEWFRPLHKKYREMCCDCALVHRMEFRVVDGQVEIRVWRDERATAAARRRSLDGY